MKAASNRLKQEPPIVAALKFVANTFAELQEKRHMADYDNATFWTKTEALRLVKLAERAFREWASIRDEQIAQSYLLSLLVRKRA